VVFGMGVTLVHVIAMGVLGESAGDSTRSRPKLRDDPGTSRRMRKPPSPGMVHGFLDEFRALRLHGGDYPLRGPIERLLGLGVS